VEEINIKGKKSHYDIAGNGHDHFLCVKCGKIFDVKMTNSKTDDLPEKIDGNKVINSYRYFKGVCAECLEKTED
jgi:Fe2+ or Zn2+ uptake regulation protein